MTSRSAKTALIVASALFASLPLAGAFAATSPNAATNATVATAARGIYDGADRFRDAMGNVLPGWDNIVYGANS